MGALLVTSTVQIGAARVRLEDDGKGFPLLLLHGFPATRRLWAHVSPMLVDAGFRVLIPDLIGYGESEAPAGARIDMASQARWMLELLSQLAVKHVAIVAHDVGSAAAQLMVINEPRRISGLAVLDGVYAGEWAMGAITDVPPP